MSHLARWCVVVLAFSCVPAARAADFFLWRAGDGVVMLGDGINEHPLYSTCVEMWPVPGSRTWNLTFRSVGRGGDPSAGGTPRSAREVLLQNPPAMTVDFGMNDGRY